MKNKKGLKVVLIILILAIIGVIGYIVFNVVNNKIAEKDVEVLERESLPYGNYKLYLVEEYNYYVEDDTLFISDSQIDNYKVAIKQSNIKASTINENIDSYVLQLEQSGYSVSDTFNYSVNDYEFVGFLVDVNGEENLYTFVNTDSSNSLMARVVLNSKSNTSYESACEGISVVLLNSEVSGSSISNPESFQTTLPAFDETGTDLIPFKFREEL